MRFDQVISGIEDGIIAALAAKLSVNADPPGYAKTIESYGGDLETEKAVKEALATLAPRMPAFFVAYTEGDDTLDPRTWPEQPGEPRRFRHDCQYVVICLSDDARGEKQRRRGGAGSPGCYRMMGDVKAALGGLKFSAQIDGETKILNGEPLRHAGVSRVGVWPGLAAYAVSFDTWFRYSEEDRTAEGDLVQEVVFAVENTFEKGESNLPGVSLQ